MADGIADYLAATAPSAAAPMPAAMPPMPKMRFTDALAAAFGAGPDRVGSYAKGLEAGSQYKLRSAQTESALAEADKRRAEAMRQSQINDAISKAQSDPNFQPGLPFYASLAANANDMSNAALHHQELGQRGTIADALATRDDQLAAMEAVSGRPVERYYAAGTGMQGSQLLPSAAPTVTPVGQATIAATHALEDQRDRSTSGGFTVGGVRYNADGTPVVKVADAASNAAQVAGAVEAARVAANPAKAGTKLPPKVRQAQAENASSIANIDAAIALVEQYPNSFGLKYGLGDTVNQRLDPEGVAARAAVANIGSAKIHERTGATMAAKEAPRLTPFIPTTTDRNDAIITKLQKLKEYIQQEQDAMNAAYATPGNAPPAAAGGAGGPAPTAAPPAALTYLKAHPELKDQFRAKYGYLPEGM